MHCTWLVSQITSGVWKQGGFHRDIPQHSLTPPHHHHHPVPPPIAKSTWALGTSMLATIKWTERWTSERRLEKRIAETDRPSNTIEKLLWFWNKTEIYNPFPHVSLKPTCVSITWTLIFELFQKPGDRENAPKKREIPGKNGRVGMSEYMYLSKTSAPDCRDEGVRHPAQKANDWMGSLWSRREELGKKCLAT